MQQASEQGLRRERGEGVTIDPEETRPESSDVDPGQTQMAARTASTEVRDSCQGSERDWKEDHVALVSDHKATETEEEMTLDVYLPDDLVQEIIARLPFPAIFKSRCLSKSWLVRFSSIADLDDEVKKGLAISFQKLVGECSQRWKSTFWPVFCNDVDSQSSIAYDRSSLKWQKLPSLSFLPEPLRPNWHRLQIDGALWHWWATHLQNQLIVVNIFTRKWKLLPPFPSPIASSTNSRNYLGIWKKVLVTSHDKLSEYKVILFCADRKASDAEFTCGYVSHVYHSSSDSWTAGKRFVIPSAFLNYGTSKEYLNGVLYMVHSGRLNSRRQHLLALDLEKGSVEQHLLAFKGKVVRSNHYYSSYLNMRHAEFDYDYEAHLQNSSCRTLGVCNGNLLMVDQESTPRWRGQIYTLSVREINVPSRLVSEVARSSECLDLEWSLPATVCDGKSILFRNHSMGAGMLEYDLADNKFRSFPISRTGAVPTSHDWYLSLDLGERGYDPFRPGLNTFVVV